MAAVRPPHQETFEELKARLEAKHQRQLAAARARRRGRMRRPRRLAGAGYHTRKGIYSATAAPGDDLGAAAEIIAEEARRIASSWSTSIPGSIEVEVKGKTAIVSTAVPAAYPNETGSRHPVYARGLDRRKWTWTEGNKRPFLGPAVDAKASEAVKRYAERINRMIDTIGETGRK